MLYNDFCGERVSALGFGMMRLPLNEDKSIDEEKVFEMVDFAIENGVNYFDTAYPYHAGKSEIVTGKALARYPRDKWFIASKYPGHQIMDEYDPQDVFEEQLKKCGVEYFDFYLLHNVYEKSLSVYTDKQWGIIEYFKEQKRLGRIRHLGFSTHATKETLESFLDSFGDSMDFCQIQLNYLDWTLQGASEKYKMLEERNIPIVVMEPLRGGRLSKLDEAQLAALKELRPSESAAGWSFRFVQDLPDVKVTLSGMSAPEQMHENVEIFRERKPLSDAEREKLLETAESMKNSLPCTACRYCCEGCPMKLDIPDLIASANDLRCGPEASLTVTMHIESMPEDKRPSACIGCGACTAICPQKIDIPEALKELAEKLSGLPSWEKISAERNAEAKAIRSGNK